MKQHTLQLIALALMILLSGCREDSFFLDSENTGPMPENLYETTVSGIVTDIDGVPVADAEVSLVNAMVMTNELGYFEITGLADQDLVLVTVKKLGYFNHFKTLTPSQSITATNRTRIKLINRTAIDSFNSTIGGSITIENQSKVIFKENSIIDSEGNLFDGPVIVYSHYLDPTDSDIDQYMPGNMMALNAQNEMNILQSFGMLNIELASTTGEPLNINSPATLEVEVPAALLNKAPTTIPLWYFDELDGLWKEEGSALLDNGVYKGEVNHFTTWNCDVPGTFTFLDGQVVDGRGVSFVKIKFTDTATGATTFGWIDSEGFFSGVVPQDIELLFEILGFCGDDDVLFSSTVGPFAEDQVDLGVFDISNNNSTTFFTGTLVDCSQSPISIGQVYFTMPNQGVTQVVDIDDSGNFFALVPSCLNEEIYIRGLDLSTNLVSDRTTIIPTGDNVELGNIEVCLDVSPSLGSVVLDLPDGIKEFDNCTVTIGLNDLNRTSYIFLYSEQLGPELNDIITYFYILEDANNDINNPNWVNFLISWSPPPNDHDYSYYYYTFSHLPPPVITVNQAANNVGDLLVLTFDNIIINRRFDDPDTQNVVETFENRTMNISAVVVE